jgi:hypothetical protein
MSEAKMNQESRLFILVMLFDHLSIRQSTTRKDIRQMTRDATLLKLKRLTKSLHMHIEDCTWDKAEEIEEQIEVIFQQVRAIGSSFSPIFLDAANACAKFATYSEQLVLAEIHLSFVADVCLSRPGGDRTIQFADCLECYSHIAMRKKEWEDFAICLEKCASIRRKVLGPAHPDAVRAIHEWEMFLEIMTNPKLNAQDNVANSWGSQNTRR